MDSSFFLTVVCVAIKTLLGIILFMVYRKFMFHVKIKRIASSLYLTSSSWFSSRNQKHQVFLSFLGEDVRKSFSSHMRKALESKGIDVFNDNLDIKRSMSIGRELTDAIRGAKIAVVLLSRNYASSSWCLNELVDIMKCREESGKTVMALFYNVDPTDVKKQTGEFGKAFKTTCAGKTEEEIERWIHALAKVAKIAGYHSNNWDNEAALIEDIVTNISNKLNISTPSSWSQWLRWFTGLVGVEAHMEKLEPMLCLDLAKVRMIGIWGPPAIGKTTIAKFLFRKQSESFNMSVFMENVKGCARRGCSDEHDLKLHLQQQFLSQIFKKKDIEVRVAQDRLKDKKVLVVLDEVDRSIYLDAIEKEAQWFGPGSRIIIITHDKRLLKEHGITNIYEVDFPIYTIPLIGSSFSLGTVVSVAKCFYTLLGTILFMVSTKFRFHQEDKPIPAPLSPSSSPTFSSSLSSSSPTLSPTISSSSSWSRNWKHQVFPSFHGADVRETFLSHIRKEFKCKAISIFSDNELTDAIRGSRIAIVFLSRNYASSSWCLNELVDIMKCREESGQIVMTLFYDVDPNDVKKQTGDFGMAFKRTCKGKTKEEAGKWILALAEVAKIAGYHFSNWDNEAAMIREITSDISNMLNISTPSSGNTGLVGMEAHMEKLEAMLCRELDEVRMIGIWDPCGIGKTTIAKFLLSKHSQSFDLNVYMENVKGYARPGYSDEHGLKLHLQQQFLSQIFKKKDIEVRVAQDRLKDKKVIVVLDDVDLSIQLDAMAKETKWFGPGSRIIIITQDERLLKAHGIKDIYKVNFPSPDEAYKILCISAFGQNTPKDGFEVLAWETLPLAGIQPFEISRTGYKFQGFSKQEWTDAVLSKQKWTDAVMSKQKWTDALVSFVIKPGSDLLRYSLIRNMIGCEKQKCMLSRISCRMNKYQVKIAAAAATAVYEKSVKDFDEKTNVE